VSFFKGWCQEKKKGYQKRFHPEMQLATVRHAAQLERRGVIKCPLHFLQEALYNPPSLLYVHSVWVYKKGIYQNASKRSIFQTFWKVHCVTKSLFFELETSNFG
jgi:hypothetical protein